MLVALLLMASAAVSGRSARSEEQQAETIVVTGERVKRSLKDTPSSVVVFDKRDLGRMAAPDRIQNLLALCPTCWSLTAATRRYPRAERRGGAAGASRVPRWREAAHGDADRWPYCDVQ